MRASEIKLNDLKSATDHFDAIEAIETDYRNTAGGWSAWNSGRTTHLTATAEKKIALIWGRVDRLFPDDGDDSDAC